MFFHIKVWLGVIFFGIVTSLVWVMQPTLINQVAEEQDRLRPILHGQTYERKLLDFYNTLAKKAKTFTDDKALRDTTSGINYDADDHLSKVMSYQEVHKDIFRRFKAYQSLDKASEQLLVISRDGLIVFRSSNPGKFDYDKDKVPNIPHVSDALQGRPRTGIWNIEGVSCFVASAPIRSTKRKTKGTIIGALLYTLAFDERVFAKVKNILPKGGRVVLFTATKTKSGEPSLAPIAYNVIGKSRGFLRGWFKTKAYDVVMEKYYNGMNRDLLKARIQEVSYTYMVNKFPADLSLGNIGYVLLSPIPNRFLKVNKDNFFESGGPRILSLIGFILVFLLGTWLSGAEIFYFRRVLPRLQTAPQDEFPDIPTKGLSGPWRELSGSINRIFSMIRERGLGDSDMKPANVIVTDDMPDPGRMALSYLSEEGGSEEELYGQMSDEEVKEIAASFIGLGGDEKKDEQPAGPTLSLGDLDPSFEAGSSSTNSAPVEAASQTPPPAQDAAGPQMSPEQHHLLMQQMYAQMTPEQQQHFSQMAPDQQQQYFQQYAQQQMAAQQQYAQQQQYMQQMYAQMTPEQQQHFSQMTPEQQQQYLQQYIQMQQQYAQQGYPQQ